MERVLAGDPISQPPPLKLIRNNQANPGYPTENSEAGTAGRLKSRQFDDVGQRHDGLHRVQGQESTRWRCWIWWRDWRIWRGWTVEVRRPRQQRHLSANNGRRGTSRTRQHPSGLRMQPRPDGRGYQKVHVRLTVMII